MPTKAEFDELLNKCKWEWTELGSKKGYRVIGPNGNSIFLPAAGRRSDSSLDYAGINGFYWSSTPDSSTDIEYGHRISFNRVCPTMGWNYRLYGFPVRPVSE